MTRNLRSSLTRLLDPLRRKTRRFEIQRPRFALMFTHDQKTSATNPEGGRTVWNLSNCNHKSQRLTKTEITLSEYYVTVDTGSRGTIYLILIRCVLTLCSAAHETSYFVLRSVRLENKALFRCKRSRGSNSFCL